MYKKIFFSPSNDLKRLKRCYYQGKSTMLPIDNKEALNIRKSTVSVIIPTLNEEKNIPHILKKIPKIIEEIIVVDGYSTDKTVQIAKEISSQLPISIKFIDREKIGKGNAIKCGLKEAKGDIIIIIDADLSMDPDEIKYFVQDLSNGYDYVHGSRMIRGGRSDDMTFVRYFGNHMLAFIASIFFGKRISDITYGYHGMKKEVVNKLELKSDDFGIETEIILKAIKKNIKYKEIPCHERRRLYGNGKLRALDDGKDILLRIIKERFFLKFLS